MKIKDYLESKGIKVTLDGGYFYNCEYNNKEICLVRCSGINNCFALYINKQTIMTRALLRTCVGKILRGC